MAKFVPPESHASGFYISKEEKAELIAQKTPFEAVSVEKRAGKFSDWEYVLTVNLDGEERGFTFPIDSVESRDRFLAELGAYLTEDGSESVNLVVEKVDKSHILSVVE